MSEIKGPFDALAQMVEDVDFWLDSAVAETYQGQPLAQDWARVAKATEEVGEAIEALIAMTGQNPRKPRREGAFQELLDELADVALTGIYAIQHFTKDTACTADRIETRLAYHHERMRRKMEEAADAA